MLHNIENISGLGPYTIEQEIHDEKKRTLYKKDNKVFLVENQHTIELRTDDKLRALLTEKYESVMESRFFGRGGIEIVLAGSQLDPTEIDDLIRLSYNLS